MSKSNRELNEQEKERQIRLIHRLATRLPWIVVAIVLLAALVSVIQILLI